MFDCCSNPSQKHLYHCPPIIRIRLIQRMQKEIALDEENG